MDLKLTHLPYEMVFHILLMLDGKSLLDTFRVNKDLYTISRDDYFWQKKVQVDFGNVPMLDNWKNTWLMYHDGLKITFKYMWADSDTQGNNIDYSPTSIPNELKGVFVEIVEEAISNINPIFKRDDVPIRVGSKYFIDIHDYDFDVYLSLDGHTISNRQIVTELIPLFDELINVGIIEDDERFPPTTWTYQDPDDPEFLIEYQRKLSVQADTESGGGWK